MPYYAVHKGRVPGIYSNWNDCKKQVDKFDVPIYKKFESKADAEKFVEKGFEIGKEPRCVITKVKNAEGEKKAIQNATVNDGREKIYIYTDGSCVHLKGGSTKAGYGIYIPSKHIRIARPLTGAGKQTNNRAEMTAILESLEMIEPEDFVNKKVIIFTDSQYSIYIFTGTGERYEKDGFKKDGETVPNKDLIIKALEWKRKADFTILKVRAHTDREDVHSKGNDMADRLSKEGTQMDSKNVAQDYLFKKVRDEEASFELSDEENQTITKTPVKSYFKTNVLAQSNILTQSDHCSHKKHSSDEDVIYNSNLLKSVTHSGKYATKTLKSNSSPFLVELDENGIDDDDEWEKMVSKQKNESKVKSTRNMKYDAEDFDLSISSFSNKKFNKSKNSSNKSHLNEQFQIENDSYKDINFSYETIDKKYQSTRLTKWFQK